MMISYNTKDVLTEEQKAEHSRRTSEGMAEMSDEAQQLWIQNISEGTNREIERKRFVEKLERRLKKYRSKEPKEDEGDLTIV